MPIVSRSRCYTNPRDTISSIAPDSLIACRLRWVSKGSEIVISIIIPAFNEEAAVADTVRRVRDVLIRANEQDVEVIVVDDGSEDRTGELAAGENARVLRKLQNLGYGNSLKMGIRAAKYDTIVITDADGTYPVEAIPELLAKFREGYDMVVGARTGEHYRESILKSPLRAVLKWLVEFTAGRHIPDANSGLRVFSKSAAIPFFEHLSEGFSFTTSITLGYMLSMKYVVYVPIEYHKRIGTTKVRLFRDALRTLQYIVQSITYYNPIKIFLVLSTILAVFGLVTGALGLVLSYTVLVALGGGAMISAVLVFAMGLLATLVRQTNLPS